jgi:hypothetical protein
MLLTRTEEIRIIISHLNDEKNRIVKTLSNLRIWSRMANVNLNEYPLYLNTKADLFTIGKKIDEYKNLL